MTISRPAGGIGVNSGAGEGGPAFPPAAEAEPPAASNGQRPAPLVPRGRAATLRRRSGGRLGAGLVDVPRVSEADPAAAVMAHPQVPEARRFCSRCGDEVGRGPDGVTGECGRCGNPYSFAPRLRRGDLVASQYRIVGCLAYGGMGWIYLARDEQVSQRWVVLKGMLDAQDPDAMAAAIAERQFLARVEHPNVVRIYNFVQREGAGYIVMEYVGGKTLKDLLRERRRGAVDGPAPLPLEVAIAYVLGILPAFQYLHGLGLAYNDLKPDNVMLQGEDVKLIDLGAVTRLDDPDPDVYGTDGYQAPEVAERGPSVASDLYSIARCLAVLALDFPGFSTTYRNRLPDPLEQPLLGEHESLHRFLLKGTAPRPEDRFRSADEMAEQLLGVLREVVAVAHGSPALATSTMFGGDLQPFLAAAGGSVVRPDWRHLPPVGVNQADPASSFILNAVLLRDAAEQVPMLREAIQQGRMPDTPEVELGLARALIEMGDFAGAEACLCRVGVADEADWRVAWYRGLSLLAQGRPDQARAAFDRVLSELPGELAPKLALALAAELAGDLETAARLYGVVATADPSFTSACFGLGRVREARGDRAGAVAAYATIPPTSSLHVEAQLAVARVLMGSGTVPTTVDDLARASATIEELALDEGLAARLTVELLERALDLLEAGRIPARPAPTVLGRPLEPLPVRVALEQAYRDLARLATGREKIRLIDRANQVRPMTTR